MIQLVLVPSDESCLMCGFVAGKRGTHILNGLQSRPRIPRSCPHVEVQPWNPRVGYTPTFHMMFFYIPTLHMVSSCCWWTLQLFCFFVFFLDKSHTSLVPIVATYSNLLMEPSFLAKFGVVLTAPSTRAFAVIAPANFAWNPKLGCSEKYCSIWVPCNLLRA